MKNLPHAILCLTSAVLPVLGAPPPPSTDTLKQVLTLRLKSLLPGGMTERNVLFQDVRASGGEFGSYSFQVTADIRDYGPGYPGNRFYGTTCVNRLTGVYTLSADQTTGKWRVDGRMTPPLATQQCKSNPSAGVSGIPLSSLSGTPAVPGEPAAASTVNGGQSGGSGTVAPGSYQCWANGQARLLMNFQIASATQYVGSDGKPGSYAVDANGTVSFRGGALDGVMPAGFVAHYHSPRGRPTVSFRGPGGAEAAFCQNVH